MKSFLTPLVWALAIGSSVVSSHAQTNTETRFAELNQADRRDVAVPNTFSPLGNRTESERFGDDGSAAIVDASGIIIWRTSDGVYRPLPNTQLSKPLFVSNSECIVWRNAYADSFVEGYALNVSYFRLDSQSGSIRESSLSLSGNKVLDTPLITTTTSPYILVTAGVTARGTPDATGISVYRLTFDTANPQVLRRYRYNVDSTLTDVETVMVAADCSQVLMLRGQFTNSGDDLYRVIWIRPDGQISSIFKADDDALTIGDPGLGAYNDDVTVNDVTGEYFDVKPTIRPVELSASNFIFGSELPDQLYHYSREQVLDKVQEEPFITLPLAAVGTVVPMVNFTQKGYEAMFVTQNGTTVSVNRLQGKNVNALYQATLPDVLGTDVSVVRLNVESGFESVAVRDRNNRGIVWLHNGPGTNLLTATPTTNFSIINEIDGRALFVTPGELIIWTNALVAVQPNGSLPAVVVKHFGRDAGTGAINALITDPQIKVVSDSTDPGAIYPSNLRGTQVLSPFLFTKDPDLWRLETGEKISGNSLRVRRYQLVNKNVIDSDGDGLRDGMERGPFYIIPGTFTYAEALADAARRGGRLASIIDAADYAKLQAALLLQQRNSPLPLPKLTIPYPLWMGIQVSGGVGTWEDATSNTFLNTNWSTGEPSAVPGRTRGRMKSDQKWEAVAPTQKSGYVLELPVTDETLADTDGDGASDNDELFALLTDPTLADFASATPAIVVPFTSPLVFGAYEGFLTDPEDGPLYSLAIQVSSTGSVSGRINGASGTGSFRGLLASNGTLTMPVSFRNGLVGTLKIVLAPDAVSGIYRINGSLEGYNGNLVFNLRRAIYSATTPTSAAGNYTVVIPAAKVPKSGQPNGDGYLTGTISPSGLASFRGFSSEGSAIMWSGRLVEGDLLSFYSKLGRQFGSVSSNLFLRNSAKVDSVYGLSGESDLDGTLIVTRASPPGAAFVPGYRFRSEAYGSRLWPVSYGQLLSNEFTVQPNNALLKFTDGPYSGQDVISTWTVDNKLALPATQTRSLSGRFNARTGELRGSYKYNEYIEVTGELPVPPQTDPEAPAPEPQIGIIFAGYTQSASALGGVVLQKSGEIRGYYTGNTAPGKIELLPNLDGTPAPITKLSPKYRLAPSAGVTYKIYLTTSEPWAAVVDSATANIIVNDQYVPWVKITKVDGTEAKGYSSAELIVTVSANTSTIPRSTFITIAGIKHTIDQDGNLP